MGKVHIYLYAAGGHNLEADLVVYDKDDRMARISNPEPDDNGKIGIVCGYKATIRRDDGSTYESDGPKHRRVDPFDYRVLLCDRCGKAVKSDNNMTTGYGINEAGEYHCFACCGLDDAERMETSDKITLYLSEHREPLPGSFQELDQSIHSKFYRITNWPGTFAIPLRNWSVSVTHEWPFGRYTRVTRVLFTYKGRHWRGAMYGDHTQIIHCRRLKEKKS